MRGSLSDRPGGRGPDEAPAHIVAGNAPGINYLAGNGRQRLPAYTDRMKSRRGAPGQVDETTGARVGRLLKQWRERRRMSQLGLAAEA
jgi:hypothetical protein